MKTASAAEARAKQNIINIRKRTATAEDYEKVQTGSRSSTDDVTVSEQARKKLAQEQQKQAEAAAMSDKLMEQMEQANESAKSQADSMETARKCLVIASRIMAGDEVPQKDERYLAKNDSKLYMQAIMMRKQKSEPKKYKSITDEASDTPQNMASSPEAGYGGGGEVSAPAQGGEAPSTGGEGTSENAT